MSCCGRGVDGSGRRIGYNCWSIENVGAGVLAFLVDVVDKDDCLVDVVDEDEEEGAVGKDELATAVDEDERNRRFLKGDR